MTGNEAGQNTRRIALRSLAVEGGRVTAVAAWPGRRPLLADVVPVFERLGVRVADAVSLPADGEVFPTRLNLLLPAGRDAAVTLPALEEALTAAWAGEVELDGLSQLAVTDGFPVREITVLRAACRYLAQSGAGLSRSYIERTVLDAPEFARGLLRFFGARHDPDGADPLLAEDAARDLDVRLTATTTLDEDRILRGLRDVLAAVVRTNAYQVGSHGRPLGRLALKIAAHRLAFLPTPRPWVETFVYSPTTEGLHLRGAPVARGGIRWSERPQDFRTEVLGLLKAQLIKNAVIVPAGAKGAFVLREDVRGLDRETVQSKVAAAYETFVSGLLDVTDNLVDGVTVHPPRIVVLDEPDSYLVVAADKGTATFSDLANGIARERGYWLGDAFASGGSAGYDHKAMGITARGAWVSVRRHLRELGTDPQSDPITVVGVGDMSGDVFGNGMLLSPHLLLVAAFDHRHVFLDPDPDPASSFAERKRLAGLPGSTWADYDVRLLSPGGGVHRRDAKAISLSAEAQRRLGVTATELSPDELIRSALRAPVDLLWNGGIGTYVRAAAETDQEVGDRANDAVRVTAESLRCRVIGEGGNLGLTQRARVAAARSGVRVNADFIDNSAGVDTSDREVNLKILLDHVVADGELTWESRDRLLRELTDEVAAAVLADNALQARALTVCADQAPFLLDRHARLISDLEQHAGLDRELEHLPSEADIERLRSSGAGLTRPEAGVLLAYSKNLVRDELLGSDLPEDRASRHLLHAYFPQGVRERWPARIDAHPLAREIAATQLANRLLNRVGPGFLHRLEERHGVSTPIAARAFLAAEEALGLDALWGRLDDDVPLRAERLALTQLQRTTEHVAHRLLHRYPNPQDLAAAAARLANSVRDLGPTGAGPDDEPARQLRAALSDAGAAPEIADGIADLTRLGDLVDIGAVVDGTGAPLPVVLVAHRALGERLGLASLRACAEDAPGDSYWVLAAKTSLRDLLDQHRADLTAALVEQTRGDISAFQDRHAPVLARFSAVRQGATKVRGDEVARLSVLTAELHRFLTAVR